MAMISTDELFGWVKDALEKAGCTEIKINDISAEQTKSAHTTREAMNKLPKAAHDKIERLRSDMKVDGRHRELYISKGNGYIECLRDVGIITEQEHKMLKCYLTV